MILVAFEVPGLKGDSALLMTSGLQPLRNLQQFQSLQGSWKLRTFVKPDLDVDFAANYAAGTLNELVHTTFGKIAGNHGSLWDSTG